MSITYSGITPTMLFDTSDLQNTEKLSRVGNKLVKNRNGVCAAMVVDWLQKCQEIPGGVTQKSQLKSGLALALSQTAYMRHVFEVEGVSNRAGFMQSNGLGIENSATKKKTFFSTKQGRLEKIALACVFGGYIFISINGAGGHALGYRQIKGVYEFFDPNEGVLQFNSSTDFVKWFPAYIKGEYPDLVDTLVYTRVTA